MAGKIIKLDDLTINKIAAGEVIERPASVVKELVENSIDAGSTIITINIIEGEKKRIEIVDNGTGMIHTDVLLSVQRHSTSKINSAEDLFSIHSLGFRGEALASVVSVAQVEIISKHRDEELGTQLIVEGGKIITDKRISAPQGTKISVKNLFFNVPVRRKFLKSINTEINHITEYITKLALAFPEISISLTHNGKELVTAPKADLISQITAIFDKNIAKGCIAIDKKLDNNTVSGFITKPEFSRKSRDYLYLFVNKRPILNKVMTDAILQGYGTTIPHDRFPIVFLFLEILPEDVDVNVHPAKKEIKFSKEKEIFTLIESAISEALQKTGMKIFEKVSQTRSQPTLLQKTTPEKNISIQLPSKSTTEMKFSKVPTKKKEISMKQFLPQTKIKSEIVKITKEKQRIEVIGVIKDTYIVAETEEGLFLCDQHAAHEKINYIKYIKQLKQKKVKIQQLLVPISLDLKPSEFQIINELIDQLKLYGFDLDIFGKNKIVIRSIPAVMGVNISYNIAKDIIDIFKENVSEIKEKIEYEDLHFLKEIISIFACRRSVKAGDRITISQAEELVEELLATEDPFTCPHGRPTIIILNEKYIEELFKRDYR